MASSLTQQQIEQIRRIMNARYEALVEEIRGELERSDDQHYVELAGRVRDVADESVADALADMNAAIVDRQIRELREIEAARTRMANGTYGICVDCGAEIPFARLLAYPTARRDITHQEQHEKTYAGEETPSL